MPYSDPDVQREFNRNLFFRRYQTDPEFREAESFRKARWYKRNHEKILRKIHESRAKAGFRSKVTRGQKLAA
jgi:hypothetical protein